jgi:hypothetical protein
MAAMLRISRSYWVHLRHGNRNPGRKLWEAALDAFPEVLAKMAEQGE